jgi:hypothetical protein
MDSLLQLFAPFNKLTKDFGVQHALYLNFTELAWGALIVLPFANLLKGAKITFGAVAKGTVIGYPCTR